ncbi:MAG TPA: translocation/assembly module TamB domain-containing protein [Vicinamibacterales bacterium]
MRRLVHVLTIVATLIVGAAAAAAMVSQTSWFKNWLRGYIVRAANEYVNGTVSIERLGGNLFFGVEMENVGLSMDGSEVVAVKSLGLDYNVFQLIARGLSVDNIRLSQPVIYLRRDGNGWELSRVIKKQAVEADRSGPARPVSIDAINISDGSVMLDSLIDASDVRLPGRIEHLDAALSFKYEPVRYSVEFSRVSFRSSAPEIALNELSGGVSVKDDTIFLDKLALRTAKSTLSVTGAVQQYLSRPVFNLRVSSDKLSLPEIAQVVTPLAGIQLEPSFSLKAAGPLDRLNLEADVQSSAGRFSGTVVADLLGPGQSVAGSVSVRHLDLAPILKDPKQKSDLTADARVNLHGDALANVDALHGDLELDSPRVAVAGYVADQVHAKAKVDGRQLRVLEGRAVAYGARVTASGAVTLPAPGTAHPATVFDLRGDVGHLDLRRLPKELNPPPADTDVNASYHAAGSTGAGSEADATKALVNLRFEPSTIAGARISAGSTANVTFDGRNVSYRADATVAGLDLERVGNEFRLAALADSRYASRINGHVTMNGRGTSAHDLDLAANGTVNETAILGGQIPRLAFDATVAQDSAHVKAEGDFSGFDPAVPSGKPALKGTLAGSLTLDATLLNLSGGVTVDSVQGDARLSLAPSTIGGVELTSASVDASYRDSIADVRTLEAVGPDIQLTAHGMVALDEAGRSNLQVHAEATDLASIGKLVDAPLDGIARADATVTGNRHEFQAAGTLTAGDLAYGSLSALTVASNVTAKIPDLDASRATIDATTHATFITVGGQNLNELEARTTYRNQQLDFDATAKQPQRTAALSGSALIHTDLQEIHLKRLNLQAQGQTWQLAGDEPATIRYATEGAVTVEQVALSNGDQQIAADGSFGRSGDAMTVTLTNVDLAGVNALLLRPPQFTGRLNASAKLGGTRASPSVDGTFAVTQGGFQQFRYDRFDGTVRYAGAGVTVDTKLQQSPTTYLTAKGYVPAALWKGGDSGNAASARPDDRIDLHVESTPIDLGLVQGFTSDVSKVTGTLQAKIDVAGSAGDPRPTGTISVAHGAFTAVDTGVAYTNMTGRLDLLPDKVHIDNLYVLDNHNAALSITGDLAIREGQIGGVQLFVTSRDFKIVDNKLGNIRINSDLEIAGQLSAPRIDGELAVNTGQVGLDEVLSRLSDSPYATNQVSYTNDEAQQSGSPFDPLQIQVHLTVPNDLVVKANDLQAPGAPIGLGAINVTLGGDLWVSKAPWDQVRLVGRVNTVRGSYDFQGRRFDILRDGQVRFDGTDTLDPALNVRTQRVIQGVTANVTLSGTLTKPVVLLTSTPPLDQADILSLIVFNQPINQLGEGQQTSVAARAQQLATGAVAGEVAQSIGKVLGVDTFEIGTAPESGAAAHITVGQQVGKNLYVKVEQDVGDQNQTSFIVEYELTKWLRLRTNFLQGSPTTQQLFQRAADSGIDLLFFFSY